MSDCKCSCGEAPKLIFSCSGAADVGEVADRAARRLTREGVGRMFCLAGIGGRVSGILKSTEAAERIVAVDGCPLDCARRSLEQAGFKDFVHVRLSDLGFRKGESPATEGNVCSVVATVTARLAAD
ncbi:MAG: putative zinc-binding protein [Desulfovibrionaceae bacterium]|nr:putative zinc-binding protein [Desulfovibrionaceae bacterium]